MAIAPLTPLVSGQVTSYSVSPPLPPGLVIDQATGVIQGVPATSSAATPHVVTASNAAGSATFTIMLSIAGDPPAIAFAGSPFTWRSGIAIPALVPESTGGAVASWSIDRPLPSGLNFNVATGVISGSPTAAAGRANYRITASNGLGSSERVLSIGVHAGSPKAEVLFDLGYTGSTTITKIGRRAVSSDAREWTLWNLDTGQRIARGTGWLLHHDGERMAMRFEGGGAIHSVADGRLLSALTVAEPTWLDISSDLSYWMGLPSGGEVQLWSLEGVLLATRPGVHWGAILMPGPTGVGIIPYNSNLRQVHLFRLDGTNSCCQTFLGSGARRIDRTHFATSRFDGINNYFYTVYSYDGEQRASFLEPESPSLGHWNGYYWSYQSAGGTFRVMRNGLPHVAFAVGSRTTHSCQVPLGSKVICLPHDPSPRIYASDLITGARTEIRLSSSKFAQISADGGSEWLISTNEGLILRGDGSTIQGSLTHGKITHVDANDARIAVATASGSILHFDGGTLRQEGILDFGASRVRLSADGTTLLAMSEYGTALATQYRVQQFSLPSGAVVVSEDVDDVRDISLSQSGSIRAVTSGNTATYTFTESPDLIADAMSASNASDGWVRLFIAPNDDFVAYETNNRGSSGLSHLRRIGQQGFTSIPGNVMGWLDDRRLLVNRFQTGNRVAISSEIYDTAGALLGSANLGIRNDARWDFQLLGSDRIYLPATNSIQSLNGGVVLWAGPAGSVGGGVAGPYLIYQDGHQLIAEPH